MRSRSTLDWSQSNNIFVSIKMFKLLYHCNNIVKTTQLSNDQTPKFYCQCECSNSEVSTASYKLQHKPSVAHFDKCTKQNSFFDWSLWQVAPYNLKSFFEFGDFFRFCFKLAVSLQHCTSHAIVHSVYIRQIWRPLVLSHEIWTVGPQPVLCTTRCVCGRAVLLEDKPGEQPALALKER